MANDKNDPLAAIRFDPLNNQLWLLDQRRLPHQTRWVAITSVQDGWRAIREMQVRVFFLCVETSYVKKANQITVKLLRINRYAARRPLRSPRCWRSPSTFRTTGR